MGMRKRSVEPDSPQSTVTLWGAVPGAMHSTPFSSAFTVPPMAHTPFNVASISALWSMGPTRHGVLHSAAESNARCAALLLGGMRTSPLTWAGR